MTSEFRDFLRLEYQARGRIIRKDLSKVFKNAIERSLEETGSIFKAANYLRNQHDTFPHMYCLLLYATNPNYEIYENSYNLNDIIKYKHFLYSQSDSLIKIETAMTILLDQEQTYMIMLQQDKTKHSPWPINFSSAEELWPLVFAHLSELAQAIIVIGNYNKNIMFEMGYLDSVGLGDRVLMFINDPGFLFCPTGGSEKWFISDVSKAVKYVAQRPTLKPVDQRSQEVLISQLNKP